MPILFIDYTLPVPRTESGIWYAFNKNVYGKNRDHWLSGHRTGIWGPYSVPGAMAEKMDNFFV